MAALTEHVGHDDATRITPDHIVDWKTSLLAGKLGAGTVKNTYLAGVKTVFRWGVANRKIATNPASNISVTVPKKPKVRDNSFKLDEVTAILRAASKYSSVKASALGVRARRWVPWVCAYAGARVGEIAQLRGCDVRKIQGHWVIHITPEAGPVKNGKARFVPIHRHLIEMGFLEMVKAAGEGPLFYEWPAAGLVGTEIGCFHLSEVHNATKEVQPRVQA